MKNQQVMSFGGAKVQLFFLSLVYKTHSLVQRKSIWGETVYSEDKLVSYVPKVIPQLSGQQVVQISLVIPFLHHFLVFCVPQTF